MTRRLRQWALDAIDTVNFWLVYGLYLLACAIERDEDDDFDLGDRA